MGDRRCDWHLNTLQEAQGTAVAKAQWKQKTTSWTYRTAVSWDGSEGHSAEMGLIKAGELGRDHLGLQLPNYRAWDLPEGDGRLWGSFWRVVKMHIGRKCKWKSCVEGNHCTQQPVRNVDEERSYQDELENVFILRANSVPKQGWARVPDEKHLRAAGMVLRWFMMSASVKNGEKTGLSGRKGKLLSHVRLFLWPYGL